MSWKTFICLRMMSRTRALDHPTLELREPALERPYARQPPLQPQIRRGGRRRETGGKEPGLRVAAHALELFVEGIAADQVVVNLEGLGIVALAVVQIGQSAARGGARLVDGRR